MLNAIINWITYIETPISQNKVVLLDSSAYIKNTSEKVMLEEFEFSSEVKSDTVIINFYKDILPTNILTEELEKRLAIVPDDIFSVFVKYAVEIRTRIRIDQTTGVVEDKALFTEELLPSESIFYGFVFTTDPFFGIDNDLYNILTSSFIDWEKLGNSVSSEKLNILKEAAGEKSENGANKTENRYLSSKDVINQLEKLLDNGLLQLGADSTLGRGFVKVKTTSILFSNSKDKQEAES